MRLKFEDYLHVPLQALLNYIKTGFNMDVYWKTLNENGVTKERMLSYDRPVRSEPKFRADQKDGLIRDLTNYLRTLKANTRHFSFHFNFECEFLLSWFCLCRMDLDLGSYLNKISEYCIKYILVLFLYSVWYGHSLLTRYFCWTRLSTQVQIWNLPSKIV